MEDFERMKSELGEYKNLEEWIKTHPREFFDRSSEKLGWKFEEVFKDKIPQENIEEAKDIVEEKTSEIVNDVEQKASEEGIDPEKLAKATTMIAEEYGEKYPLIKYYDGGFKNVAIAYIQLLQLSEDRKVNPMDIMDYMEQGAYDQLCTLTDSMSGIPKMKKYMMSMTIDTEKGENGMEEGNEIEKEEDKGEVEGIRKEIKMPEDTGSTKKMSNLDAEEGIMNALRKKGMKI